MSNKKNIISTSILISVISILSSGITFLINVYLARFYGDDVFAKYSYLTSLLAIVSVVTTFGFGQYLLLHLPAIGNEDRKSIIGGINTSVVLISIITSLFIFFYLGVQYTVKERLIICAVSLLMSISLIRQSILFSMEKILSFQLWDKLIRLGLFFLFVYVAKSFYSNSDFFCVIFSFFLSYVLLYLTGYVRSSGLFINTFVFPKFDGGVITESFYLFVVLIVTTLMSNIDVVIIEKMGTTTEVALYSAAQKIALISGVFINSLTNVVMPKLVRSMSNKDKIGLGKNIKSSLRIGFAIIFAYFIFVILLGDKLLRVFGDNYSGSHNILILLVFSILTSAAFGQTLTLMRIKGESKLLIIFIFFALLLKFTLSIVFYKQLGTFGVSLFSCLAILFWNVMCYAHLNKKFKIKTAIW